MTRRDIPKYEGKYAESSVDGIWMDFVGYAS